MTVSCASLWMTGLLFVSQCTLVTCKEPRRRTDHNRLKEFPLSKLFDVAMKSNDANRFIRMNKLRGKPLDVQYEWTREQDLNTIEYIVMNRKQTWKRRTKSLD